MSTDDKQLRKTTSKTKRTGGEETAPKKPVAPKAANAALTTDAQLHLADSGIKAPSTSSEDETVKFGAAIKAFRAKAGFSQAELAEIVHVSRNTVVKWENDGYKPDHDTIIELCKILGMSLDELYGIATTSVSQQELRMIREFRRISPVGQKVIEKMIYHMLDEELMAKDELMKASCELFETP